MKPRVTGRCADRKSTAHFVPQHPPLETGCPLLACMLSHSVVSDSFAIPWTVVFQAPLPMEFPRQEYWNGFHFLLQGIFLTQESNPCLLCLLHWQMDSLPLSHLGSPTMYTYYLFKKKKSSLQGHSLPVTRYARLCARDG